MGVKLTKAQRHRLATCLAGPQAWRHTSATAMALYVEGLIKWDDQAGGGLWWAVITPAGRATLTGDQQ